MVTGAATLTADRARCRGNLTRLPVWNPERLNADLPPAQRVGCGVDLWHRCATIAAVQYFDHNATSPLCPEARAAWLNAVEAWPGNPSSPHRAGARADRALNEARQAVAQCLGARPEDLVWTSGATEACNAVIHHVAVTSPGVAWISSLEHPCIHAAAARWLPGRHRSIPALPSGLIDLDWLRDALMRERPALVAVMAANNETGILQPWPVVRRLCAEHDVPFFCDAAQWLGKMPAHGLGECAFVSGCAHKFGGPAGVGFLKCPAGFTPFLAGGAQEEGRRAGTENVAGAVACAVALRTREAGVETHPPEARARRRDEWEEKLSVLVPGVEILGRSVPRLWNTSAFLMPPVDCRRRWVVRLDKLGFAVSTGSACASGREKPSHVLAAMGRDGTGERMLRVSAGWETAPADWDALLEALVKTAAEFSSGF